MSEYNVHMIPDSSRVQNFSFWRADSKVTDSYAGFTRYVWTEAVSRKKKLQIQKYPDTCGRGLSRSDKKTHFIGV